MVLSLIGFMGVGKTYWGGRISRAFGYAWYDLDKEIERVQGQSINRLFDTYQEDGFRLIEREVLENLLLKQLSSGFILSTGGGTPCYMDNICFIKRHTTVVWLRSSEHAILHQLLNTRHQRPLISRMSLEELRQFITKKMEERQSYYEQAHYTFCAEKVTIDDFKFLLKG